VEIGAGRLTWHPGPFWSLIGAAASLRAARLSTDTRVPSRYSVGREIPRQCREVGASLRRRSPAVDHGLDPIEPQHGCALIWSDRYPEPICDERPDEAVLWRLMESAFGE
jgi:hypothetical protein